MAAGLIVRNVTTASGVTIPTLMWADDTDSPTEVKPVALLVDADGVPIEQNSNGRAAAAASAPVALSNEDKAVLDAIVVGASPFFHLDLDETKREIKGAAGRVMAFEFANHSDETLYVKWYNAPAASVTVGSTTPAFITTLPARDADDEPSLRSRDFPRGLAFSSGITVAIVTGSANDSTGAPDAGAVVAAIAYE